MDRKRIFEIIETSPTDSNASNLYDIFMIFVIILSLVPLAFKTETTGLIIIDKSCVLIFIIDYILRWLTADYKFNKHSPVSFIRYPLSFMAIIDLVSILPSLSILNNSFKVLRIMRMFRTMRVVRIFKAARYSKNLRIIAKVFRDSREPLITIGSLAVVYILVSALVIINVEPDSFDTFFDAVYWATVSLTTVGYGDIYPITNVGRLVTMLSSIFGIAIVALPSGIITAGYLKEIQNKNEQD